MALLISITGQECLNRAAEGAADVDLQVNLLYHCEWSCEPPAEDYHIAGRLALIELSNVLGGQREHQLAERCWLALFAGTLLTLCTS